MGERGIDRPVWKPQGTKFTFQWPMGMSRGQRDYLTRVARGEVGDDPARMVLWLQKNAWLHTADKKRPHPPN